jgi:hypothetical protein
MSTFYNGETINFSVEIRKLSDKSLFDPSTVKITITFNSSVLVNGASMTNDSVGVYSYDYTATKTGTHKVKYEVTDGSKVTIETGTFITVAP